MFPVPATSLHDRAGLTGGGRNPVILLAFEEFRAKVFTKSVFFCIMAKIEFYI